MTQTIDKPAILLMQTPDFVETHVLAMQYSNPNGMTWLPQKKEGSVLGQRILCCIIHSGAAKETFDLLQEVTQIASSWRKLPPRGRKWWENPFNMGAP